MDNAKSFGFLNFAGGMRSRTGPIILRFSEARLKVIAILGEFGYLSRTKTRKNGVKSAKWKTSMEILS